MTENYRMTVPKNYSGVYFSQKTPPTKTTATKTPAQKQTLLSRERPTAEERAVSLPEPKAQSTSAPPGSGRTLDLEELLLSGIIALLLREGGNDFLPLALAALLV